MCFSLFVRLPFCTSLRFDQAYACLSHRLNLSLCVCVCFCVHVVAIKACFARVAEHLVNSVVSLWASWGSSLKQHSKMSMPGLSTLQLHLMSDVSVVRRARNINKYIVKSCSFVSSFLEFCPRALWILRYTFFRNIYFCG